MGCTSKAFALLPSQAALSGPGPYRVGAWVMFGMLVPMLAFALDNSLHVDPVIWGGTPFPHMGLEPDFTLDVAGSRGRQLFVLGAAAVSLLGLVLTLARRHKQAAPLLAIGIALSTVHAVAFVPLIPISAIAILVFGVGLLGFAPFAALWVYVDALRHVYRTISGQERAAEEVALSEAVRAARRPVGAGATKVPVH